MAKKTIITFTDDVDGSEATGTVEFAVDGKAYEIDLSEANKAKLRAAFAPFVEKARPAGKGGRHLTAVPSSSGKAGTSRNGEAAAKRAWLAENGYPDVANKRGRFTAAQEHAWNTRTAGAVPAVPAAAAPAASEAVSAPEAAAAPSTPKRGGRGKGKAPVASPFSGEAVLAAAQAAAPAPVGRIKLTGLSGFQVKALREHVDGCVESGATTAVMTGDVGTVRTAIEEARASKALDGRAHLGDRRALAFVLKKLDDPKFAKAV